MSTDLTPRARRELEALAHVRGPLRAEAILITHQRRDVGSCLCGWAEFGKSHAGHQADALREAGLLIQDESDDALQEECQAETRSWEHFKPEQIDSYWIRCTARGPHSRHKDGHTGLTWTDSTP